MRNAHCRNWDMARKLKITENEKYTLQDVKYAIKGEKGGKFRNVHSRMWNIAKKLKIIQK